MSTLNRLDLETLESQLVILKSLPGHCFRTSFHVALAALSPHDSQFQIFTFHSLTYAFGWILQVDYRYNSRLPSGSWLLWGSEITTLSVNNQIIQGIVHSSINSQTIVMSHIKFLSSYCNTKAVTDSWLSLAQWNLHSLITKTHSLSNSAFT
jgi:hypothetical protein